MVQRKHCFATMNSFCLVCPAPCGKCYTELDWHTRACICSTVVAVMRVDSVSVSASAAAAAAAAFSPLAVPVAFKADTTLAKMDIGAAMDALLVRLLPRAV